MEPKRYHHGDLKRTLLKVADQQLAESGVSALSLREVAKQAGVSHTAPYKHFRDKNQLLKEMVAHEYKGLIQFAEEVEWRYPENLELQLASFAERFLQLGAVAPRKLTLMLSYGDTQFEVQSEISNYHTQIRDNLAQLFVSARVENESVSQRILSYWYGLVGATLLLSQKQLPKGSQVDELAKQLAAAAVAELR